MKQAGFLYIVAMLFHTLHFFDLRAKMERLNSAIPRGESGIYTIQHSVPCINSIIVCLPLFGLYRYLEWGTFGPSPVPFLVPKPKEIHDGVGRTESRT